VNTDLNLSRIRALCFDVDGTLSDTDDQFVHNLVRMMNPIRFLFPGKNPYPFARKLVMKTETPGNYLIGLPDRFGFDRTIASLGDRIYQIGLGKSAKPFLLIPGIEQMLTRLQPHYPMSVVSARGARSTGRFLHQFNLSPFFVCIATAQTCDHTKPYPDPILWAAERMSVRPSECLMIGDTTVDILAARAAGAQSVGVLCGFGERDELVHSGANRILENTALLTELLLDSP
jgi:phosphoglycolate phosphatase-like HAD superfamily hydrolase